MSAPNFPSLTIIYVVQGSWFHPDFQEDAVTRSDQMIGSGLNT